MSVRVPEKGRLWSLPARDLGRWKPARDTVGRQVTVWFSGMRDASELRSYEGQVISVAITSHGTCTEVIVLRLPGMADYAIPLSQISHIEVHR